VSASPRCILTRPAEEAQRWRDSLEHSGVDVVAWPLIDIQPVTPSEPLQAALQSWSRWAAVMFVSRAAVQHAMAWRSPDLPWGETRCWATGPGTQQALLAAGVSPGLIDTPDAQAGQFDTEHLWQKVQHQVTAGQQVLLLRGTEAGARLAAGQGRDWLTQQLHARGLQVQSLAAYVRSVPRWSASQCQQAREAAQDGSVWLFSSSQALTNLQSLLPGQAWHQAKALATHPRIAETAQKMGWGVVRTSRPTVAEIRSSLESFA
jgi:uroporphyrinogen-III synthase